MTTEQKVEHTPGPLRVRQAGEVIEIVAGEGWGAYLVATVPALSHRQYADAVLFAASSDLLEAVDLFLANEFYHAVGGRQDVYDRQYERAVERLRAASEKARVSAPGHDCIFGSEDAAGNAICSFCKRPREEAVR